MTVNAKRHKYYLYVALLITFSVFLRFFLLTNQSLWIDEGLSLSNSDVSTLQESIARISEIPDSDRFQPLYFIILFWWRQAFGDSEFALRSLSALLGIGSVIVIFFTTLRIYGKNHALWSSLILAFSSFSIYYSQEVRNYALLIFLASLQLYFFSPIFAKDRDNEVKSRLFFWLCIVLGLFGSVTMFPFTAALCVSHLFLSKDLKQWLQWWLPAALFSLPVILFYLGLPGTNDPTTIVISRQGFPIIHNALFVLYGILVGTTYGPSMEELRSDHKLQIVLTYWPHLLLLATIASVIFLSLVIALRKYPKSSRYYYANALIACLFVTSFFLGFVLALVTKMNWVPRHSFYLCLPLAMLIPLTFLQRYKHRAKSYSLSKYSQLSVIFLIILNIYSLSNYYFNKNYWRDDYRSAIHHVLKNRDSSEQPILFWANPRLMKYYGNILTIDARGLNQENFTTEKVRNLTGNADMIFVLVNREFYSIPKAFLEREMSNLYRLESKVNFPYFNVYRYRINTSEHHK